MLSNRAFLFFLNLFLHSLKLIKIIVNKFIKVKFSAILYYFFSVLLDLGKKNMINTIFFISYSKRLGLLIVREHIFRVLADFL